MFGSKALWNCLSCSTLPPIQLHWAGLKPLMLLMATALVVQRAQGSSRVCSLLTNTSFNLVPSHGELVNCCSRSAKHSFSPGLSCSEGTGLPSQLWLQLLTESAEFSWLPQITWAFFNYLIEKVTLKLILTTLPDWFFCEEEVSVTLEEFVFAVLSLLVSLCHKKKKI